MKKLHAEINDIMMQIKLMKGVVTFGHKEISKEDSKLLIMSLNVAVQALDQASYITMSEIDIKKNREQLEMRL